MKRTSWFIFFLFLAVSCLDTPDCFRINNDLAGITFRVMGSSRPDSVTFKTVVYSGYLLNRKDTVISQIILPLNYFQEQVELTFERETDVKNLVLGYRVQTQFISDECGTRYVLSDLAALNHNFDSIRVINTNPGAQPTRNMEVFRCPVTNVVTIGFHQLIYNAAAAPASRRTSRPLGVDFTGISNGSEQFFPEPRRAATVHLPVTLSPAETTYLFDFETPFTLAQEKQVSLKLDYEVTETQRFTPCGLQSFVSKLNLHPSTFDSVSIVRDQQGQLKDQLLDPHEANIYVFRCPQTNLVQINFRKSIPESQNTQQDTVHLKGIRTNYSEDVFYQDARVSTIVLPLNEKTTSTVFYFDFITGETEEVTVNYRSIQLTLFNACNQQSIFSKLEIEGGGRYNVPRDSVQFPPVTNIEIIR